MASPLSLLAAGLIPGGSEWIVILIIVLLLFGGAKLPSLARGLGQSIKEFKKASKDIEEIKDEETKKPADPGKTPGAN